MWHEYGEMAANRTHVGENPRNSRPLNEQALRELALAYVARYATSSGKLAAYLKRKIRARGFVEEEGAEEEGAEEGAADPDALIQDIAARMAELGYVDDEAYAKARAGDLMRRGYGQRRIDEALRHAGIDETARLENAPSLYAQRRAALTLACKRRFGPFGASPLSAEAEDHEGEEHERAVRPAPDMRDPSHRKKREKQIAAMLRAGHGFDAACFLIDCASEQEAQDWLDAAREEE